MGGIFSGPPDPPTPPSPQEQAEAQQVTQLTPQGNLIYGTYVDGEFVPSDTQTAFQIEQTPFQQQIQGIAESLGLSLGQQFQSQFGSEGLTPLNTDFSQQGEELADATYQAGLQRIQPQFDLQRDRLQQQLADQGVPMGSEAYDEELRKLEERQNEQLSRLSLDAVQQSRAEQSRLANLAAQTRAQQFGEIGTLLGIAPPFQPSNAQGIDLNANFANQILAQQLQQQGQAQQAGNFLGLGSLLAYL